MTLTKIDPPFGLNAEEVARILNAAGGGNDQAKRIDCISELFLGRPYIEGSLGGGPEESEEFRVYLDAFDCVTYIEVVLALAVARTTDEFVDAVRRLRYEDGEIDWFRRNHYMVDWARNNVECGFISNITTGPLTKLKTSSLNLIAGLPARTTSFDYYPVQRRLEVTELFQTGDLIFFVSIKETLDVFHTGLLIEREGQWLLRHATRKAGAVIEQKLSEFMDGNEMAGFVILRPLCRR